MTGMVKTALFSVTDKGGLGEFARALAELDYGRILSTGGTAEKLREAGLDVTEVADFTGSPEMLGGRVKTLHPKIHGGILDRPDNPGDQKDMVKYGLQHIDLVCVNLYQVKKAIGQNGVGTDYVMNETDIGGVAMLRAAAKNFKNVVAVCDPADYPWIIEELKLSGDLNEAQRLILAEKVFALTARYDAIIDQFLAGQYGKVVDALFLKDGCQLAYAENRCQNPAHLFSLNDGDPLAMDRFRVVSGGPSYISIADSSQIVDILCLIAEAFRRWLGKVPYIAVSGKHGNPSGAAISWNDPSKAILKALYGDSTAVMGGEMVVNFHVDDALADTLFQVSVHDIRVGRGKWGLDIILAPSLSEGAVKLLGEREKRRLLANEALAEPSMPSGEFAYRQVRGGFLRQMAPDFVLTPEAVQKWSGKPPSDRDFATLIIAWAVCWRASSNTVALAKDGMLIGLGCGQQDRIACVRLCLDRANKAGHDPTGSVFASDAFFPYAEGEPAASEDDIQDCYDEMTRSVVLMKNKANPGDIIQQIISAGDLARRLDKREGPQLLADAGCIGGVVPADGKELPKVHIFFEKRTMSVAFLPKEFRGFSKH